MGKDLTWRPCTKIRHGSSMNGSGLICFDKSSNKNLTFPSEANLLQLPSARTCMLLQAN